MTKYESWVYLLIKVLRNMGINKKGRTKILEFVAEITEDKKYLIRRK